MNILQEVQSEHSKAMCDRVVRFVGSHPRRFEELIKVFLKGPYRVTQRVSWPLSCCVALHPALIKPHLKQVINNLDVPGQHIAVKRNTIRLLQFIEIPLSMQGRVTDICFKFLCSPHEPIAVRVFSMSVLGRIAKAQPALRNELRIVIEDQLPYGSAGFISRAVKLLKEMKRLPPAD